jgi:hypothetical protein
MARRELVGLVAVDAKLLTVHLKGTTTINQV